MSKLVVDASVAVKWFLDEDFSDTAINILTGDHDLLAPDFIHVEVGNVIWKHSLKGRVTSQNALEIMSRLRGHGFNTFSAEPRCGAAIELALTYNRSVYDCLYLALAIERDAVMVTADERLVNALTGTPLEPHITWIGSFSGS